MRSRGLTKADKMKILLVDDDWLVGDTTKEILKHLGYGVDFYQNPVEALSHFQQDPCGFELVVTDMTMPIMTGRELALEIMKVREDIPVIICTGYSITLSEKEAAQMGVKAVVMKPLTMSEFEKTVRKVMEGMTGREALSSYDGAGKRNGKEAIHVNKSLTTCLSNHTIRSD